MYYFICIIASLSVGCILGFLLAGILFSGKCADCKLEQFRKEQKTNE